MNTPLDDKGGWQRTLLPFMTRSIAVMGLLFFFGSSLHLYMIHRELGAGTNPPEASSAAVAAEDRWQALFALEREARARDSRSINAVIMRQSSLLHLGFMTGMVLCLVGSIFVLGRLDIEPTRIDGEAQGGKFGLSTSSPGILLVCLGCGLICATLFHRFQFNLPEKTVYLLPTADPGGGDPPTRNSSVGVSAAAAPGPEG
jgi:hypothetical protein